MAAFLRATELQPSQLTAWQGFAAFLEQERSRTVLSTDAGLKMEELKDKLIFTYDKLAELLNRFVNQVSFSCHFQSLYPIILNPTVTL